MSRSQCWISLLKNSGNQLLFDVEDYELELLKGLSPIDMISFEFTVPEQTENAILCLNKIEKFNPDIECNYSVGEDMVWALREWISVVEVRTYPLSPEFNRTCFGNI